jgi:RNA polymerase sigma factor (TIGR02999 family)
MALRKDEVTGILNSLSNGEAEAPSRLLPLVYDDLRRLAAAYFANERTDHTLQPTALVHEAYIRLVNWEDVSWQNRAHFFALAAEVMRHILVDHARRRSARKRGSGQRVSFDEGISYGQGPDFDLIDLDDALRSLAELDGVQSKIVELRFFGGLSIEETAQVLGVSGSTVKREWSTAKIWLYRRLKND